MLAGRGTGWILPVAVCLLCACSIRTGNVYREKGLVSGQPGMNRYSAKEAGETSPLDRPYSMAPPLIPHRVAGMTIVRDRNECLDCHLEGMEVEEGHRATKVPASHFRNGHAGEGKGGEVAGVRYICTQCHIPQADGEPPVPQMAR